jgi:hypothetical protein
MTALTDDELIARIEETYGPRATRSAGLLGELIRRYRWLSERYDLDIDPPWVKQ